METKKSIWTIITGGLSSAAPILFSVCKGGACVGVCVSPIASIFGISSATIAASPLVNALEPLLIAISAISFTASYYTLYVLPKAACNSMNACDCAPNEKGMRKLKITKSIFWMGLILSIGFLSYFEYQKYQVNTLAKCSTTECLPGKCDSEDTEACSTSCEEGVCETNEKDSISAVIPNTDIK